MLAIVIHLQNFLLTKHSHKLLHQVPMALQLRILPNTVDVLQGLHKNELVQETLIHLDYVSTFAAKLLFRIILTNLKQYFDTPSEVYQIAEVDIVSIPFLARS